MSAVVQLLRLFSPLDPEDSYRRSFETSVTVSLLGLLVPEDENIKFLRNVGNELSIDTA